MAGIIIIPDNLKVEATLGGGGETNEGIGLDYDFMWFNITENLSNVVHDDSIWGYGDEVIRMGRAFGTKGDNYTANYLKDEMNQMDLEDVTKIPLGPIKQWKYLRWHYTSKLEPLSFKLQINNVSYPFANPIPINEMFVFPSASHH